MNKQDKMLKDLFTGDMIWWFSKPEELMRLALKNLNMKIGIALMGDIYQLLKDIPKYVQQGKLKIDDALFEIIPSRLKDFILKLNNI